MKKLIAEGVKAQTCITSPPYWQLRDYGNPPSIWGGDPECDHDFDTKRAVFEHRTGLGLAALGEKYAGGGHKQGRIGKSVVEHGTCAKCGAWRGALGLEPTPELFTAHMAEVFGLVREVLADDGTLWLNLGDSYARNGGITGGGNRELMHLAGTQRRMQKIPAGSGLKPKDLAGIPWRVAFALQGFAVIPSASLAQWADWLREARETGDWELVAIVEQRLRAASMLDALQKQGWYLRQDIIWAKGISGDAAKHWAGNPMPESATDRCTKSHEYLFLLSKSDRYYFDQEAIREPVSKNTHLRMAQDVAAQIGSARAHAGNKPNGTMKAVVRSPKAVAAPAGVKYNEQFASSVCLPVEKRNKRSVWTVATRQFADAHFATYPPELISPCILAGSRPGDTVFDPFFGSGTTGEEAQRLGRNWIACEINETYAPMQSARTTQMGLVL